MAFANSGNQGAPGQVRDTMSNYPARRQQQIAARRARRGVGVPGGDVATPPLAAPEQPGLQAPISQTTDAPVTLDGGFSSIPNGQITGPAVEQTIGNVGSSPSAVGQEDPLPMSPQLRATQLEGFKDALRRQYDDDGRQNEMYVQAPSWMGANRAAAIRQRIGNRMTAGAGVAQPPMAPPYTTGQGGAPGKTGQPAPGLMPGL